MVAGRACHTFFLACATKYGLHRPYRLQTSMFSASLTYTSRAYVSSIAGLSCFNVFVCMYHYNWQSPSTCSIHCVPLSLVIASDIVFCYADIGLLKRPDNQNPVFTV